MQSLKTILFSICALIFTASCEMNEEALAPVPQSLEITFSAPAPVGDAASTFELISRAYIKNNSDQIVRVKVRRVIEQPTLLTDNNSICWEYCYVESIDESPDAIELFPGELNQDFTGHVYPDGDGRPAEGEITYIFFNEEAPDDRVLFTTGYRVE